MVNKKAQLTILIILGIVLLMIFGFVYFIANYERNQNQAIPEEFKPISTFAESCLKLVAENATWTLTRHGGDIKELVYDNIPAISEMEIELSEYINDNIDACLNDFEVFKEQGFVIEFDEHNVDTGINQEDITFTLVFPLSVKKGDSLREIDKFVFSYDDVSLPFLRRIAIQILEDEEWLNRDLLLRDLSEKNIQMDITSYDKFIVYSLVAKKVRFSFGEMVG